MANKKGIVAGILALMAAFIVEIPIYPDWYLTLNFRILNTETIEHYFWGHIIKSNGSVHSAIFAPFPENLVGILVWMMVIFVGLFGLSASTMKSKPGTANKLYRLNMLMLIVLLFLYTSLAVFIQSFSAFDIVKLLLTLDMGWYVMWTILSLNIAANKGLKKE